MAGIARLYGFRQRNADVELRKSNPFILMWASSFNRHNVHKFDDNRKEVINRSNSFPDGTRIF